MKQNSHKFGLLTVISGPMFSGKTENLIHIIKQVEQANDPILVLRPAIDNRSGVGRIKSHKGNTWPAFEFDSLTDFKKIIETELADRKNIALDEAQFLSIDFFAYFDALLNRGINLYISGLDRGSNDNNLPIMNLLFAYADQVKKLFGTCSICHKAASKTRRIDQDGNPIKWIPEQVKNQEFVGGKESYQPLCRSCFINHEII